MLSGALPYPLEMASAHVDVAWDGFRELEDRFAVFLRAVPPRSEHNRVHSPALASLLLDGCSLIETTLKSTMDNARYNGIANIAQHRARRYAAAPPFLNIGHLRQVFRADSFYAKPVWYVPGGNRSFPWYVWRNPTGNPRWWASYNNVKHSRFDNASEATLGTTMHAMKALFLVLVQSLEFRARLVERGVIRSAGLAVAQVSAHASNWEPLPSPSTSPVVASSSLFGYKYLSQGSPTQATGVATFL